MFQSRSRSPTEKNAENADRSSSVKSDPEANDQSGSDPTSHTLPSDHASNYNSDQETDIHSQHVTDTRDMKSDKPTGFLFDGSYMLTYSGIIQCISLVNYFSHLLPFKCSVNLMIAFNFQCLDFGAVRNCLCALESK